MRSSNFRHSSRSTFNASHVARRTVIGLSAIASLCALGTPTMGQGYTLVPLAAFNKTNGSNPYGALTPDGAGNYYGTTRNGGANGAGALFEYSVPAGIQLLASFSVATM